MNRTIQPEDRIAHYRVVGPLGSGGMGEVYLADDEKLERSVALKVLPFDLVRDEERVRRFVREAKSASSLNHPNIVTIYEIGHEQVHAADDEQPASDPIHFISMELVAGETLGAKIRAQKTDIRTLLGYLTQTAEGVAKAHSAGIVHRDLKPSNIMVSQDGFAKVLDFGLAKLVEHEPASADLSAPTVPLQTTKSGQALGTVGYMSPEQIRGSKVDHRSDIFSFGCVLYECVTGQRAFRADTDVETLHQILHQAPTPVEELNPEVPHALQRLINRCLRQNPDQRLQSMKDLAIELQEILDEYETLPPSSGAPVTVGSRGQPTVGGRRISPVILGLVAVVGVVGLFLVLKELLWSDPDPRGVASRAQPRVTGIMGEVSTCALSPDGKYLAYASGLRGRQGLWVRQLATGSTVKLSAETSNAIDNISFSRDGSYVYFGMPQGGGHWDVFRVASLGGSPERKFKDVDSRVSFSPDGRRACFRRGGIGGTDVSALIIADLDTGEERTLSTASVFTFGDPAWSPSGERIATFRRDSLVVIDAATGDYEALGPVWNWTSSCAWLPDDSGVMVTGLQPDSEHIQIWHVTYPGGVVRSISADQDTYDDITVTADGRTLGAQRRLLPANLWSAPLAGAPAPQRLTESASGAGGMSHGLAVVDDGSIAVVWERQLRLLDGEGTQIRSITSTPDRWSEDPRRVADGILFLRIGVGEGAHHIWHVDLAGGSPIQLTMGPGEFIQSDPVHKSFLYVVRDNQLEVFIGTVGEAEPRKIPGYWPCAISPDGKWVFATEREGSDGPRRIVVRSLETLEPKFEFPYSPVPAWTPESDAIAHVAFTRESQQIVLQPIDGSEPSLFLEITPPRLDTRQGRESQAFGWSPDGKNLCMRFLEDGVANLWVVPSTGGEPRRITDFRTGMIWAWEWSRDSQDVYFTQGNPEHTAVLIQDFN